MVAPQSSSNQRGRFARRPFIIFLIASLAPFAAVQAAPQLFINQSPVSAERAYHGTVELAVVPPFEDARISVAIDGQYVAEALRRPYRVGVDLGPAAVEHRIEIFSTTPDGSRRHRWHTIINPGSLPLSIKVRPSEGDPRLFEAKVTAPRGEKITAVEFYDENGLVAKSTSAPWRVSLPERSSGDILTATARLKSGAEVTDIYAGGDSIHAASYDVRTVRLMVSVTDKNRARASGLQKAQFEILDKGTRAEILDIEPAHEQPISLALLIDASASILPEIKSVSRAASSFVSSLIRPQDRCSVFSIRTVPKREVQLTSDIEQVQTALQQLNPMGQTAIYDGIRAALRELQDVDTRKAMVLLTDGEDTSSISSYDDILQKVKVAGVPLYVIIFNDSPEYERDRKRLTYLANESGGFLTTATANNLIAKYREIERDLREQYAIKYQVTAASRPNEWRDVKVVVKARDVEARTIKGYFTP
jgi:Ca-activated chloride channel homolog